MGGGLNDLLNASVSMPASLGAPIMFQHRIQAVALLFDPPDDPCIRYMVCDRVGQAESFLEATAHERV
jgi:hypothetical protein